SSEEVGTARLPRKRREGAKDGGASDVAAEARLDAPDGEHHAPLHAECALDAVEQLAVLVGAGPAAADEDGRDEIVVVALERDCELRLAAIAGDDARKGLEADERLIDEVLAVAALPGLFDERAEPFLERLLSGDLCGLPGGLRRNIGGEGAEQSGEHNQDRQTDTHASIVTLPCWICSASAVVSLEMEVRHSAALVATSPRCDTTARDRVSADTVVSTRDRGQHSARALRLAALW